MNVFFPPLNDFLREALDLLVGCLVVLEEVDVGEADFLVTLSLTVAVFLDLTVFFFIVDVLAGMRKK